MNSRRFAPWSLLLLIAVPAFATTFIVPTDDELLDKSNAVVVGIIQSSHVRESDDQLDTVYELRINRRIKGPLSTGSTLTFVSPGGFIPGVRGLHVSGSPQFAAGERVLLFLTLDGEEWRVTDLTLGKFRFATSRGGARLLVRDMDDVFGWEKNGQEHREPLRLEDEFIEYLDEHAAHRPARKNYYATPEEAASAAPVGSSEPAGTFAIESNAAAFPAATYTDWVSSQPTRRNPPSATFYKRSDTNIPGAVDGGISVIQAGLAARTNAPGTITLTYGGQQATPSKDFDSINMVEFNDPQGRVAGSWTGSGTVAITFTSYSGTHTYESRSWWSIMDADVVFQDGYTATNPSFPTAMTHELGHAIGFRHSNQHYDGGGTCNPSVEECTSVAIMNSTAISSYGYTLQPYDLNAVSSVYADGTTTTPGTPGGLTATATSTTSVQVSWGSASNATQYELERSTNIAAGFTKIATVSTTSYTDGGRSPNTTYVYRVRAVNSGGAGPYSNLDHATTIIFTDDPLTSGLTVVKAVHLAELRTAVNAVRAAAGLSAAAWTDAAQRGVVIKAIHITELRNALAPALSALGKSATFTDPSLVAGTPIRAVHFQEIRNLVK